VVASLVTLENTLLVAMESESIVASYIETRENLVVCVALIELLTFG
jgi:hypothetical protein